MLLSSSLQFASHEVGIVEPQFGIKSAFSASSIKKLSILVDHMVVLTHEEKFLYYPYYIASNVD